MNMKEWRYRLRVFLALVDELDDHLGKVKFTEDRTTEWWQEALELLQEIENLRQEVREFSDEET
jgi:hypothetical protein